MTTHEEKLLTAMIEQAEKDLSNSAKNCATAITSFEMRAAQSMHSYAKGYVDALRKIKELFD